MSRNDYHIRGSRMAVVLGKRGGTRTSRAVDWPGPPPVPWRGGVDRLRYTPPTDCDLRQQQRHTRTDADRRQRQPHRQTQRQMDRIRAKQERHENGEKRTNKGFERLTEKGIAYLRLDCFPLGCPPGSLNSRSSWRRQKLLRWSSRRGCAETCVRWSSRRREEKGRE